MTMTAEPFKQITFTVNEVNDVQVLAFFPLEMPEEQLP